MTSNGPGIKGACDRPTGSGALANVDVRYEFLKRDRAVVVSDLHFDDDRIKHDERTQPIREDGAWKVSR